jgi:hypothetical protein
VGQSRYALFPGTCRNADGRALQQGQVMLIHNRLLLDAAWPNLDALQRMLIT